MKGVGTWWVLTVKANGGTWRQHFVLLPLQILCSFHSSTTSSSAPSTVATLFHRSTILANASQQMLMFRLLLSNAVKLQLQSDRASLLLKKLKHHILVLTQSTV